MAVKQEKAAQAAATPKVFTFNPSNAPVRVQTINNEPWFVAKDVCDALTIGNSRDAIARLDDDEKGMSVVATPSGEQQMNLVNESGLYNLIFQSRKPEAKAFRKWVASEVLPSIRRTGRYEAVRGGSRQAAYSRAKRAEFNLDIMRLLWLIDSNLNQGDRKAVALVCGVSRNTVCNVLRGQQCSPRVLYALYERALLNLSRNNLYIEPERAVERLARGLAAKSDSHAQLLAETVRKGGAL